MSVDSVVSDGGPVLKATLGEFTRRIESLSARSEPQDLPNKRGEEDSSDVTYYTAQVTSVSASSSSVVLRQRRQLARTESDNTGATSFNNSNAAPPPSSSNRNSVLSGQVRLIKKNLFLNSELSQSRFLGFFPFSPSALRATRIAPCLTTSDQAIADDAAPARPVRARPERRTRS